jgi:tetratricopeptide (TPR) repeat protein
MNFLPAYRLKIYRNFKSLEAADFHGIVRYYERFEQDIHQLDFDEYFDCLASYTQALFEIGDHRKHLVMCDFLLETIIIQNVETWGGEDLYTKTLLSKATSQYYLQEYELSAHILQELIKINPEHSGPAKKLWEKCILRQKPGWLMRIRALGVGVLLFTAAFIAFEIFVIAPFFSEHHATVQFAHNLLMILGILILFAGELRHMWLCHHTVSRFLQKARHKKHQ